MFFRYLWCLTLILVSGAVILSGPAHAAVTEVATAEMTLAVGGTISVNPKVSLPYDWDKLHGPRGGEARFVMRLPWDGSAHAYALHMPRVGNQYSVKVNGREIFRSTGSARSGPDEFTSEPALIVVPQEHITALSEVEVAIVAVPGKYGGLSHVFWGPTEEIRPLFVWRQFLEVSSRRFLGAVTAVLGLFGILMWIRLREAPYLWYGLSELLWTLLTLRTLVDQDLIPWPWMPLLLYRMPLMLSVPLMYKAMLPLLDSDTPVLTRILNGMLAAAPLMATVAVFEWAPVLVQVFMLVLLSFVLLLAWISVRNAWSGRRPVQVLIASVFVLLVLCGVRDGYVFILSIDAYVSSSWLRFAWIVLGLSFVWIAVERVRKSDLALVELNASLSQQLGRRSVELSAAFDRERYAEKERGATEERQRLMRDLHDGLGSQLAGALRIAQNPSTDKAELVNHLRDAIDHMKVTVDAMQETEGDIPSMLGAVRYRLAPRLKAAGIALAWDVQRLPTMPHWTVKQAYQLQMLLLEAFTNMMVHAEASKGCLSATLVQEGDQAHIEIKVTDNGKGFDVERFGTDGPGKGLSSMRLRSESIGGQLQVTSAPGETSLVLRLPLPPSQAT